MDHDADLVEVKDEVIYPKHECSICGQDLVKSDLCYHWPGETYLVDGKEIVCHVLIHKQKIA